MKFSPQGYGTTEKGSEYWSTHRSKLSELYKSEAYFFTDIISTVNSVLDIGCAAGGSAFFSRELNSDIQYWGVDISPELIQSAKNRFTAQKNTEFINFDGKTLPFGENEVELVFSFGVFHHLENWKAMVEEALRVSGKYVLFDLRAWSQESLVNSPTSYQKIALGENWDNKTIIQYNIQSFNEIFEYTKKLQERMITTKAYGYYTKPTPLAVTPAEEVLMLAVLLEKNTPNPKGTFTLE